MEYVVFGVVIYLAGYVSGFAAGYIYTINGLKAAAVKVQQRKVKDLYPNKDS